MSKVSYPNANLTELDQGRPAKMSLPQRSTSKSTRLRLFVPCDPSMKGVT